jgi:hypothetical protein
MEKIATIFKKYRAIRLYKDLDYFKRKISRLSEGFPENLKVDWINDIPIYWADFYDADYHAIFVDFEKELEDFKFVVVSRENEYYNTDYDLFDDYHGKMKNKGLKDIMPNRKAILISTKLNKPYVDDSIIMSLIYHECIHEQISWHPKEFKVWERTFPLFDYAEQSMYEFGFDISLDHETLIENLNLHTLMRRVSDKSIRSKIEAYLPYVRKCRRFKGYFNGNNCNVVLLGIDHRHKEPNLVFIAEEAMTSFRISLFDYNYFTKIAEAKPIDKNIINETNRAKRAFENKKLYLKGRLKLPDLEQYQAHREQRYLKSEPTPTYNLMKNLMATSALLVGRGREYWPAYELRGTYNNNVDDREKHFGILRAVIVMDHDYEIYDHEGNTIDHTPSDGIYDVLPKARRDFSQGDHVIELGKFKSMHELFELIEIAEEYIIANYEVDLINSKTKEVSYYSLPIYSYTPKIDGNCFKIGQLSKTFRTKKYKSGFSEEEAENEWAEKMFEAMDRAAMDRASRGD